MAQPVKSRIDQQLQKFINSVPWNAEAFDQVVSHHTEALIALRDMIEIKPLATLLNLSPELAAEVLFRFARYGSATRFEEYNMARDTDHRTRLWRVCVTLYNERRISIYDTVAKRYSESADYWGPDPDSIVCSGLLNVASYIGVVAETHHGYLPAELEMAALKLKIAGLRPTLSRTGGKVMWRGFYTTQDSKNYMFSAEIRRADLPVENIQPVNSGAAERLAQLEATAARVREYQQRIANKATQS